MRVLIDSNVFVAALIESHENHVPSRKLVTELIGGQNEACMSAHGLAETYSQLTSHPRYRISPEIAIATMTYASERMEIVSLDSSDYSSCLKRAQNLNVSGGGIYDLLHVEAAAKAGVSHIATYNLKHFERLCAQEVFEPLIPEDILERK